MEFKLRDIGVRSLGRSSIVSGMPSLKDDETDWLLVTIKVNYLIYKQEILAIVECIGIPNL